MADLVPFPTGVIPEALVAYVHHLSFMVCFAALALQRKLIRSEPGRGDSLLIVITDVVYGLSALTLTLSGILRVLHYGRGTSFYTENPLFWLKVATFVAVGVLSLYPTVTFLRSWAGPLRRGELPQPSEALVARLRLILNLELAGFAALPLLAALMARGVGLAP